MKSPEKFSKVALVTLALGVLTVLLCSCAGHLQTRRDLDEHIREQLKNGATHIDLGKTVVSFPWDRVAVFSPYYPKDGACQDLALSSRDCARLDFKYVDENEYLLIFLNGKEVTGVESVSRWADFEEGKGCIGKPFARDAAVFTVSRKQRTVLMCPK